MSATRRREDRALNDEERALIARTHHPALQDEPDRELTTLIKLIRERRDRARDQARDYRRVVRGKAAPKGAKAATSDEGSKLKAALLGSAVRRLNSERQRRSRMAGRLSLIENARKAFSLKQNGSDSSPSNSRHASEGMRDTSKMRPENLIRPMERGRLKKAAAVAQATKDNRGEAT